MNIKATQEQSDTLNKTTHWALATSKTKQGNAPNHYYMREKKESD